MILDRSNDTVLIEHSGPIEALRTAPRRWLVGLIRLYQMAVSPALAPACRYLPSCSEYAAEAIEIHGAVRGSWLAIRRVGRCHPFHAGGHDPVPPRVPRDDGRAMPASAGTEGDGGPAARPVTDPRGLDRLAAKE